MNVININPLAIKPGDVFNIGKRFDHRSTELFFEGLDPNVSYKLLLLLPNNKDTSVTLVNSRWLVSNTYTQEQGLIYAQLCGYESNAWIRHGEVFRLTIGYSLGNGNMIEEVPPRFEDKFNQMITLINDIEHRLAGGEFNGFSPTVYIEPILDGHKVNITDKTGVKSFNVMDGAPYTSSQEFRDLAVQIRTDCENARLSMEGAKQAEVSSKNIETNVNTKLQEVTALANQVATDKNSVDTKVQEVNVIANQVKTDSQQVSIDKTHIDNTVANFNTDYTNKTNTFNQNFSDKNKQFNDNVTQSNASFDAKVQQANTNLANKETQINTDLDLKITQANTTIDNKVKQASDSATQAQTSANQVQASVTQIQKNANDIALLKTDKTEIELLEKTTNKKHKLYIMNGKLMMEEVV